MSRLCVFWILFTKEFTIYSNGTVDDGTTKNGDTTSGGDGSVSGTLSGVSFQTTTLGIGKYNISVDLQGYSSATATPVTLSFRVVSGNTTKSITMPSTWTKQSDGSYTRQVTGDTSFEVDLEKNYVKHHLMLRASIGSIEKEATDVVTPY